jgi:hypothetical protein
MHPKGLGEYWEKPGMTTDSWRTDWVSCGGINDGGYSAGVPPRSSEKILRAAIDTKLNHLWVCMSRKAITLLNNGVLIGKPEKWTAISVLLKEAR